MDRLLTTQPKYVFIFEATDEGDEPVIVRVPRDVTDAIRAHLRGLQPGEQPDMSQFKLPPGLTVRCEQKTSSRQVLVAFEGVEVPREFNRTENYVPEGLRLPAPWTVEMGERPETRRLLRASWGCADELNRDHHGNWDWADVTPDQSGKHWSHFSGYREQVDIQVSTHNYRRHHDWKGYDDVRGTTHWTVAIDRIQVGEGSHPDPFEAMLEARAYAKKALRFGGVSEGPMLQSWRDADSLIGLPVRYRQEEAVVTGLVLDQGCVIIKPAMGEHFVEDRRFGDDGWSNDPYERQSLKVELFSPDLYWHRRGAENDVRKVVATGDAHD